MFAPPLDAKGFGRILVHAVAIPLLLMVLLAGLLIWQVRYLLDTTRWIDHTDQVIAQANYTQKLLVDMETGLRGYLVTGSSEFLEPYTQALDAVGPALDNLGRLVADNPRQGQQLAAIRLDYERWSHYAREMITLRERQGAYQGYAINARGKQQMDTLRGHFATLLEAEETLRDQRVAAAERVARQAFAVSIGAAIAVALILAFFVRRQLLALAQSYGQALAESEQQARMWRESEARFRRLAENAPDIIYRYRLDPAPAFDYVSPAVASIIGYSPEEHYADPDLGCKLVHPEDLPNLLAIPQAVASSETPLVLRWVRRDGTIVWTDHRILPIRDEVGNLVAIEGIARDITARVQSEAALRQNEERYRRLVETSPDAILLTNLDGMILHCNQQAARLYGCERVDDLLWQSTSALIVPVDYQRVRDTLRHYFSQQQVAAVECTMLRRDGSQFPAELSASALHDSDGQIGAFIGVVRDITPRRRTEAQIQRQVQRLNALRTIDIAITASLDLRVTLSVVLDQVATQLGVDAAAILLLDWRAQTLDYAAGRGFRSHMLRHTHLRLGEGYAGRVAAERRLLNHPNLAEAENFRRAPLLLDEGFVAYYGAPLIAKGQVKGVLEIFHRAPLDPDPEWLDFLEALAGQAAIAIDNATLFDDLQRSNLDLMLAYDTTLEGWSSALDLRDRETEGHTQRVTAMTLRLARALGQSETALVNIRRGALLHDIGKMGVPDAILLKPGPLNDEEWAIMRRHPALAYELLAPIAFLKEALDIPYYHHEKWDGSGYPHGLKGEVIPLAARIFAVVDVWDAMRSDRPYRKGRPEAEVRAHLQALSGSHFDPRVVAAFLDLDDY